MKKKNLIKHIEDFSRALEQGKGAVYRLNYASDSYEYMGDYIQELSGYSAGEITPQLWSKLVLRSEHHTKIPGLVVEKAHQLSLEGKVDSWQKDVQIRTRTGEIRWVSDMSTVLRDEAGERYGTLGVLMDITDRKQAEETARVRNEEMMTELAMARDIQQMLVSQQPNGFPSAGSEDRFALQFVYRYLPAEMLAGDFFRILPLSDHEVGVFLCDVVGHGVRSALLTTFIHGLIDMQASHAADPGTMLQKINQGLISTFGHSDSLLFASACYLVVDSTSGVVRFSNAGHHPPACILPDSHTLKTLWSPDQRPDAAVGIIKDNTYEEHVYAMTEGETILLYTDGIFEVHDNDGTMYGEERLSAVIEENMSMDVSGLMDTIISDVHRFSGADSFEDDVCLLGVVCSSGNGS